MPFYHIFHNFVYSYHFSMKLKKELKPVLRDTLIYIIALVSIFFIILFFLLLSSNDEGLDLLPLIVLFIFLPLYALVFSFFFLVYIYIKCFWTKNKWYLLLIMLILTFMFFCIWRLKNL